MKGLIVDLFAGGGGASAGIEAALGRPVDIAINHDAVALAVHKANHPETRHLEADIWEVKPREATGGRPVDLLWASPDCTHFSVAKGDVPRRQDIRSLAWAVVRWAEAVRPAVIALENVAEFRTWGPLDKDGRPNKMRRGVTFLRWKGKLERLGYRVDFRVLDASAYGAPTRRKRLFLIARRDGLPIRWPEPTHGPGRLPVHTAAECIDWNLPCPSIFERKKPLADKTLWRIAQGIRRFVLENPRPFIVRYHSPKGPNDARVESVQDALPTQTTANRFGLVTPFFAEPGQRYGRGQNPPDAPLSTVVTKDRHAVVAPVLATIDQRGAGDRATTSPGAPLPTTVTKNRHALVAPTLLKVNHGKHEARCEPIEQPLTAVTATQRGHAVAAATLVQTGYGEREGQAARVPHVDKPLGTVVAGGQKHALVSAFIAKHYGGVVGHEPDRPIGAVTATDHHSLAAATLVRFNHDDAGVPLDAPAPTVTAGANHVADVRAFLTAFYGSENAAGKGQRVTDPMRTLTTKDRLGLVTVEGTDYQIVDIGMRMLEPHELLAAQFGRFAAAYDLSAARTKSGKVRLIGNSVPPEVVEAIIRANLPERAAEAVA